MWLCVNFTFAFFCFFFTIKHLRQKWAYLSFHRFTAPSVSVVITPAGTAEVGQSYSLICSVSGADFLSPTSTTYRWYNESSNPRSQVGTTNTYTLNPLQPYHAGQYTCEVTITSPYLSGDFSKSTMQDITLLSKCNWYHPVIHRIVV